MTQLAFTKDAPEKFSVQDWQRHDLDFLDQLNYSANWGSMGTYKTSTGLWLIERKLADSPGNVLIVTTKSGKGAYFDCIPSCLDYENWHVFNVGTRKVEEVILHDLRVESDLDDLITQLMQRTRKTIVLAHYHCFENKYPMNEILVMGSESGKIVWDFVLLDEAHRTKSKDVQWTRNLKKIAKEALNRHVMSGTGFVNNPSEMWSLVNFLDPDRFPSYWRFRRSFCEEENWTGYWKIVGLKEDKVQEFIDIRKSLGPRRTMQEVHKNVTEPIYTEYEVDLNPPQRRMYKEIVAELRMLDQKGFRIDSPNVVSQLQRLRQISVATPELVATYYDEKLDRRVQKVRLVEPSSKLDVVMELIEGLEWDVVDSSESLRQQMIVFSNFRDPLELLKTRLDAQYDKNGKLQREAISYIHMEQKDSEQTRFEKWHETFPRKEHQVFLSTIDLGGESISLATAQYCVFLDRSWSPAKNAQAVGRIYRPGQTGVAEIIHINAKHTVDKRVMDLTNLKTSWFKRLFDDEGEE